MIGPSRMIWPSLAMLSYSWMAARRYRSSSGLTAAGSRPKVPWGERTLAGAEADPTHMHKGGGYRLKNPAPWPEITKTQPLHSLPLVMPDRLWLTWVRVGLFHRSAISLRFSGRSSSCSAWVASSRFRQKGSSHTGLALQLGREKSGEGGKTRVDRCPSSLAPHPAHFPGHVVPFTDLGV